MAWWGGAVIAEIGVVFLVLALLVSLLQSSYLLPIAVLREWLGRVMPIAAWLQALLIACSVAVLITLRLNSDFSVLNVVVHSNLSLPTLYKIVGAWGNHEGSMLLWVFVLALFGALLDSDVRLNGTQPTSFYNTHSGYAYSAEPVKRYAVAIQSVLCAGFLVFILATSNPFARVFPPEVDGKALNPLLQDIGLSLHPPLLYFGYVGFSIVFSLAVAALICGKADREWARITHPWIMLAWSGLTLGIGLGSWWAYRELGWGGWWFWDPVENASLMPWLSGTALLHSNLVLKKRGAMAQWVVLLSIVTFALSLLGTFLVRSGIITSVHSFASDPARGFYVLFYIVVTVGGALFLYGLRGGRLDSKHSVLPVSREGMIVINNLFILSACATILLGTLYPIFADLAGVGQITVGAPYFNTTFLPLMALPLVFAAFSPFMAWKKASFRMAFRAARPAIVAVLVCVLLVVAFIHSYVVAAVCGLALSAWLALGSLQWLVKAKGTKGRYSVFLGHIGAACIVLGVTASSLWKEEVQQLTAEQEVLSIADYKVEFVGSQNIIGKNYKAKEVELNVSKIPDNAAYTSYAAPDYGIKNIVTLFPQYRTYDIIGSNTSETAIYYGWFGDLYAAVGETAQDGRVAIRLYFQPMISFIWIGCVLMALGGLFAFVGRKHIN